MSWFSSLFKRTKKNSRDEIDKKTDKILQSPNIEKLTENNLVKVQEIESESFNKLIKEKFMNQNVLGDHLKLLDSKIDENQTDARSLHSYDKSSSGSASEEEVEEGDSFTHMEIYLLTDTNMVECMDLNLVKKCSECRINLRQMEDLIRANNFFENKMIRVVTIVNGKEEVYYPLGASAILISHFTFGKNVNAYTTKSIKDLK